MNKCYDNQLFWIPILRVQLQKYGITANLALFKSIKTMTCMYIWKAMSTMTVGLSEWNEITFDIQDLNKEIQTTRL